MRHLSTEKLQFAVARFAQIFALSGVTQTDLAQLSSVAQSTISKVLADDGSFTEDLLARLFEALGYNLYDVVAAPGAIPEQLLGYLATPLTGVEKTSHSGLRKVVEQLRTIAADRRFDSLPFNIYWTGEHTHPIENADVCAEKVYLTDRSRASTHDFVILLCAEASFGVGQENEIATQAGLPAIRLVPKTGISRMMLGSFVRAVNVRYEGDLKSAIAVPADEFLKALQEIRKMCVRHRAFYNHLDREIFGTRLRALIADRCGGDYTLFADDVGIKLEYLHVFIDKTLSVSNPVAILLCRHSTRLTTSLWYLF